MLETIVTEEVITKSKHKVYGELKQPLLGFEKSIKDENNINTYKKGIEFLDKYLTVLTEVNDSFRSVIEYIDINFTDEGNINAYKDLFIESNNNIVKLQSFVNRTRSYFDSRKSVQPFILNKETYNIMTKAVKGLVDVYAEAFAVKEGIKDDGVNFLVNLL